MHPIIAKFGPMTIYSYGVMVAIAFLVGIYVARIEASRKKINIDLVYDFAFYLVIGSLIGARIYYLLFFDPSTFLKDPVSIVKIWQGGLAIHGAILGGILTGLLYSSLRRISFWKLADLSAPSILLGQAIGRVGCFLNGCCFGVPTPSILGVKFPKESLPALAYRGLAVHPTQLYESSLNMVGFFALWSLRRKLKFDGGLFLMYLMLYSCIRMVVEGLRGDNLYIWGTELKIAQILSGVVFIVAMVIFIKAYYKDHI